MDFSSGLWNGVISKIDETFPFIRESWANAFTVFNDFWEWVKGNWTNAIEKVDDIWSWAKNNWKDFFTKLSDIRQFILDIPDKIAKAFEELLKKLWIPSEGFCKNELSLFERKFGFITDIYRFVDSVVTAVTKSGKEPPSFTVHLGNAPSVFGLENVTIDFSWYQPYKPYGDAVLSAIFIICYAWNSFMHLPSMLSGANTAVSVSSSVNKE